MRQQTETTFEEKKSKFHCWWHFVRDSPVRLGCTGRLTGCKFDSHAAAAFQQQPLAIRLQAL